MLNQSIKTILFGTFLSIGLCLSSWAGITVNGGDFNVNDGATVNVTGGTDGDVTINSGNLNQGNSTINLEGDWDASGGTFNSGTGTVNFNGTNSSTLISGSNDFNILTLNKTSGTDADDNLTVTTDELTTNGLTTLTDGELIQGITDFTFGAGITVSSNGKYRNESTGDLILGGDVLNNGMIILNSSGGSEATGGDADSIQIRSTVGGTQRNWQGTGTFIVVDLDVLDQTVLGGTPVSLCVINGTDTGNNINWFCGELSNVAVVPDSLLASALDVNVDLEFENANIIPADGKISITFPAGFDVSNVDLADIGSIVGFNGGIASVVIDGQNVTITRDGTGDPVAPGTTLQLRIADVDNPTTNGLTDPFDVFTLSSTNAVIDQGQSPGVPIAGGVLTPTIVPTNAGAGVMTDHNLTFTIASTLDTDGKIVIEYPPTFGLSTITGIMIHGPPNFGTASFSIDGQTLTITRDDNDIATTGDVDLDILGITNAPAAGMTVDIPVHTTDASDNIADSGIAPGLDLIAGILTDVEVVPQDLTAATTGDVDVTFKTANILPADGLIKIVFPAEFDISGITGATSAADLDGTLTTSIDGQILTITRAGGTPFPDDSLIDDLVISGVKNPAISGLTASFDVITAQSGGETLDEGTAPGVPISGGTITPTITPDDTTAGATTNYTIEFDTATELPADGQVKFEFPDSFDISGVTTAQSIDLDDGGGISVMIFGQVICIFNESGNPIPLGTTLSIEIEDVINPSTTGQTPDFLVYTAENDNTPIDSGAGAGPTITAGALGNVSVSPQSLITSANGDVDVRFDATNGIPLDGKIEIVFPTGFDLSGVGPGDATSAADINGTLTVSVDGQKVIITRSGGSAVLPGEIIDDLIISNITNPGVEGLTGTFDVNTLDNSMVTIDTGTATGVPISGANITNAVMTPADDTAGVSTDYVLTFDSINDIPADGAVKIEFPAGFDLSGVTTAQSAELDDGTPGITVMVVGNIICIFNETGGVVNGPTSFTITIEDVINPVTAGTTADFPVYTAQADNTPIDSGVAPGVTIMGGAMGTLLTPTITLTDPVPGAITDQAVTFTTTNQIPVDGRIEITYPAGFDLTGTIAATSPDFDGTFTVSVAGQVLTLTRTGGLTALTGGSTPTINITGIQNPGSDGFTGTFPIATQTVGGVDIDAGTAPAVEIVTLGNGIITLTIDVTPHIVQVGDVVQFTSQMINNTNSDIEDYNYRVQLPNGITYLPGTSGVDAGTFDSELQDGNALSFNFFKTLPASGTRTVKWKGVINSSARQGKMSVPAVLQINPIISNTAVTTVQMIPDFIFQIGTVIGKVFWDKNEDGAQQKGEPGIPDVRVFTEEGVIITTDKFGRYHIPDVRPGRHMIKVDHTTLPKGATNTTQQTRYFNATDAMLNKVNFGIQLPEGLEDFEGGIGVGGEDIDINFAGEDEPITIQVRESFKSPQPKINVDFNSFSDKTDEHVFEDYIPGRFSIPLSLQTNFPHFVKGWKLEVRDIVKEGLKTEEVVVASDEGEGAIPSNYALVVDEEVLMKVEHERELEFTVYDESGKKMSAVFELVTQHEGGDIQLVLIDRGIRHNEIALRGSTVVLEGKSPVSNYLKVFGVPVPVGGDGRFEADFILPEGEGDIPIYVYEGGVNVVEHEIVEVQPTLIKRTFKTSDNFFIYTGFGELEFGKLSASGNIASLRPEDQSRLNHEIYHDHRLAYYAKGKLWNKYHMTVSIDTEREKRDLFTNLQEEDFYATYGDDSEIEHDATDTQDEVFVHVEWDNSYFRYGNYSTAFTGTELADFNRTLHGAKVHYESVDTGFDGKASTELSAFYSAARQLAAHVEFQATGGSLYYLAHQDVISGSERLSIEVRDKISGIVLSTRSLVEDTDYTVDYSQGRIKLTEPLSIFSNGSDFDITSTDLLQGDPQYLIVDYEYEPGTEMKDTTTGIRFTKEWFNNFRMGGTLVQEQRQLDNYKMGGLDAHLKLLDRIDIRGEVATSNIQSTSQFVSSNGGLSFAQTTVGGQNTGGTAYSISAEGEGWKGFNFNSYYQMLDRDFSSSSSTSQAGTEKYGVLLEQLVSDWGLFRFQHTGEKLLDGGNVASSVQNLNQVFTTIVQGVYEKGKWRVAGEYRHAAASGGIVGVVDNLIQNAREEEDLVGASVAYKINEKTQVKVDGQISIGEEENNQLRTTLLHKVNDLTSLFASHVFGSRGNGLLAGLESQMFGYPISLKKGFGTQSVLNEPTMQDVTLGFVRNLGVNTEVQATQTVGVTGVGKRTVSLKKGDDTKSTTLTHETTANEALTSLTHEKTINENMTAYSTGNWYRNKTNSEATVTTVKGMKITALDDRLTSYLEDENSVFSGDNRASKRMGVGILFTPEWRFDGSYEQTKTSTSTEDAFSQIIAGRVEYLKYGIGNFYTDLEYRNTDADLNTIQLLASGGGEVRFNDDLSVNGRFEWGHTDDSNGDNTLTLGSFEEYQLGFAYRPTEFDWFNMLGEYKMLKDKSPASQGGLGKEITHVVRGEFAFDITNKITLIEKYALRKNSFFDVGSSYTWLWGHKVEYHATSYLDLNAEYRYIKQTLSKDSQHGILLEAVLGPFYGFRIGGGFNFTKFSSELVQGLDVEAHGFYGRLIYDPIETVQKASRGREEAVQKIAGSVFNGISGAFEKLNF